MLTPGNYVARGVLSGDQSIGSSDAVLQFGADSDSNSWISSYKFQPTVAGWYNITLNVWFTAGSVTNAQSNIQFRKNGSTQIAIEQTQILSGAGYGQTLTSIAYFNGTTDYIEVTAFTANTTSQGINLTSGNWYQIVGTYDGSTMKQYANGTFDNQLVVNETSSANGGDVWIARRWDGVVDAVGDIDVGLGVADVVNVAVADPVADTDADGDSVYVDDAVRLGDGVVDGVVDREKLSSQLTDEQKAEYDKHIEAGERSNSKLLIYNKNDPTVVHSVKINIWDTPTAFDNWFRVQLRPNRIYLSAFDGFKIFDFELNLIYFKPITTDSGLYGFKVNPENWNNVWVWSVNKAKDAYGRDRIDEERENSIYKSFYSDMSGFEDVCEYIST